MAKIMPRTRKIIITETKIIYDQIEYSSASAALDAYIRDIDSDAGGKSKDIDSICSDASANHNHSNDSHPLNIISDSKDSHHSRQTGVVNAESGVHRDSSIARSSNVDRMMEYAEALRESHRVLHKPDIDGSTVASGTDIGTMATETLINVNPYTSIRPSRSHVYSYRTANTRSRSLSHNRKFGKALVDDYISPVQLETTETSNVSRQLLADTAEVLTTTRAEIDAIHALDKRINSLDDSLLTHQLKRSRSVPANMRKNRKTGYPPSWVNDIDVDGSIISAVTDVIDPAMERKVIAQRWLADIDSQSHLSTPARSPAKSPPSSPRKPTLSESTAQKHFRDRGNLRVDFTESTANNPVNSEDLAKQYEDLNNSALEEQKRVDKMLDDLDRIKQSFEVTANNVENLQSPLRSMKSVDKMGKRALTSTMNADDSDVNVMDDGEISSISHHVTGTKSSKISSVSSKNPTKKKVHSNDSGGMETLKTMLFTLQAEASGIAESGSGSDGDIVGNGKVNPLVPALEDYNFDQQPGGHSLQKALSHLNRLKSLVDNPPSST